MKAATDKAVGCVGTYLKLNNQQSDFAAGYSQVWSSIIPHPFLTPGQPGRKGELIQNYHLTPRHSKKSAKKGSQNNTLNTENQASKGIEPKKFITRTAPLLKAEIKRINY